MSGRFAIGERARVVMQSHHQHGKVVVIRAYRVLGPGIEWPCYEDRGELWPVNPDWLKATQARARGAGGEQLALF